MSLMMTLPFPDWKFTEKATKFWEGDIFSCSTMVFRQMHLPFVGEESDFMRIHLHLPTCSCARREKQKYRNTFSKQKTLKGALQHLNRFECCSADCHSQNDAANQHSAFLPSYTIYRQGLYFMHEGCPRFHTLGFVFT